MAAATQRQHQTDAYICYKAPLSVMQETFIYTELAAELKCNANELVKCAVVMLVTNKMMKITRLCVNHRHVKINHFSILTKQLNTSQANVMLVTPRLSKIQHQIYINTHTETQSLFMH